MLDTPLSIADLAAQTQPAWDAGLRVLQPWRFADSDAGHTAALLETFAPPPFARVLDVGCGFGETAKQMKEQRDDLEFVLLNAVQGQLDLCPAEFERVLGDAHALPFPDESFDALMFNAALCNMDVYVALAEASRVLKPGGVMFLNELQRTDGDNDALTAWCGARAYSHEQLETLAGCFGLTLDRAHSPAATEHYLRGISDDPAAYDAAFNGVKPGLWRFIRQDVLPVAAKVGSIIGRHDRIALQVSGGKDSLALLYLMMPWWPRLCVYWLNTGDAYPEMVERMEKIRAEVPYFREIKGRQPEIIAADGWPSDVVPHLHTTLGNAVFGPTEFKVQARLDCCWRSLMLPMHQAMQDAGVTLIVRGKREEEADKTGLQSGYVENGIELLFPILDWKAADVFGFLAANDIELPPFYGLANSSLDCMSCTAWLEHKNGDYLAAHYPERHTEHLRRLGLIRDAVSEQMRGM